MTFFANWHIFEDIRYDQSSCCQLEHPSLPQASTGKCPVLDWLMGSLLSFSAEPSTLPQYRGTKQPSGPLLQRALFRSCRNLTGMAILPFSSKLWLYSPINILVCKFYYSPTLIHFNAHDPLYRHFEYCQTTFMHKWFDAFWLIQALYKNEVQKKWVRYPQLTHL